MRERCADAMPIFAKYDAPDLFITFTANPKWPEITENLRPSKHTTDRPELLPDKFSTSEHIDKFVRAEIPSSIENLRLHEIVTRCLMHGPCSTDNPGAPCMEAGQCKKMFPKEFRTATTMNVSVYPLYCRCPSDTTFVRGREMDNRFVAPYAGYTHNEFLSRGTFIAPLTENLAFTHTAVKIPSHESPVDCIDYRQRGFIIKSI
ncbi:hypothetical protein AVEN_227015-1 [Araneus ventricosus]|uniref:Helitron helicase-like domain-containing protein n=1 Tax=Araneus ventricosus TaxID=182803 RepID=A0A4Y2TQC6_ARAVE|nr:hypothetical protein AVEN_227015-1 [Araneus ventricosus]